MKTPPNILPPPERVLEFFRNELSMACHQCGIPIDCDEFSLGQVAEILDHADYVVSVEQLEAWQQAGILPDGEQLTADEALTCLIAFEHRECWKTAPSRHDFKKSRARLDRESLPIDDIKRILAECSAYDDWFLVHQLKNAETVQEREQIFELLQARIDPKTASFRSRLKANQMSTHSTINLTADVELKAKGDRLPSISILAYSGGRIKVSGYPELVIDLAGLTAKQQISLLVDHDATTNGLIGHGSAFISATDVRIEGTLHDANHDVVRKHKAGLVCVRWCQSDKNTDSKTRR